MTPHRITSVFNGLDMIALVSDDGFYQCGTASGPINPSFIDNGPIMPGTALRLAYDYDSDEYATDHGWLCKVVRINPKSVTVQSARDSKYTHRISVRF